MIYELRTYNVKPGMLTEYLAFFRDVGMPVRKPHNNLVGFWSTEFGALNQVVHIWKYDSLVHRTALRAELMQNPKWAHDFLPKAMAMLDRMDSVILNSAPFSPLQ
jgi:NIPSNAP